MTTPFLHNMPVNQHTQAHEIFQTLGTPTKRVENWHYTDLQKILAGKSYTGADTKDIDGEPDIQFEGMRKITIVNGHVQGIPDMPEGVVISGVDTLDTNSEFHTQDIHAMVALNTAHYTDGLRIIISKTQTDPIHLAFVNAGDTVAVFPCIQILIKQGVDAKIIETYEMKSGQAFVNGVMEITVEDGACLDHYKIQNDFADSTHIAFVRGHVAQDAEYKHTFVCLNTTVSRNEVYVDLNGTQSKADIRGLYITDDTQKVDNTIFVRHMAEDCESSQLFKGILNSQSQGIFQGKIYVDREAQLTDGYQMHRAILLSRDAEVDCKPELEIYADDVKCSHGASTGEIDEEHLFYLKARGIDDKTARKLLLKAFLVEVLDGVENDSLFEVMRNMTLNRVQQVLK